MGVTIGRSTPITAKETQNQTVVMPRHYPMPFFSFFFFVFFLFFCLFVCLFVGFFFVWLVFFRLPRPDVCVLHRRCERGLSEGEGGGGVLVGCLMSQQHASVSQGRIRSDKFKCCHTEIEVADQTFPLTRSQYSILTPGQPVPAPTLGAWQGMHWRDNFQVTRITRPGNIPAGFEPRIFSSRGRRLSH